MSGNSGMPELYAALADASAWCSLCRFRPGQLLSLELIDVPHHLGYGSVLLGGHSLANLDAGIEGAGQFFPLDDRHVVLQSQAANALRQYARPFGDYDRG